MLALATHSGCLTCHSIKPAATADQAVEPVMSLDGRTT
jgi:hypothetical protein